MGFFDRFGISFYHSFGLVTDGRLESTVLDILIFLFSYLGISQTFSFFSSIADQPLNNLLPRYFSLGPFRVYLKWYLMHFRCKGGHISCYFSKRLHTRHVSSTTELKVLMFMGQQLWLFERIFLETHSLLFQINNNTYGGKKNIILPDEWIKREEMNWSLLRIWLMAKAIYLLFDWSMK